MKKKKVKKKTQRKIDLESTKNKSKDLQESKLSRQVGEQFIIQRNGM